MPRVIGFGENAGQGSPFHVGVTPPDRTEMEHSQKVIMKEDSVFADSGSSEPG